jgi:hypothetical protein
MYPNEVIKIQTLLQESGSEYSKSTRRTKTGVINTTHFYTYISPTSGH